jgi:hypothetical protein
MTNLPLAYILSEGVTSREVNSARPHAPVVRDEPRVPRTHRTRIAVAGLLERAAGAVAPAECAPAR